MDNQNLFTQIVEFLLALFAKSQPQQTVTTTITEATANSTVTTTTTTTGPVPEAVPVPDLVPKPSFTLTRNEFRDDGIFSTLCDKDGNIVAKTLEHSYNRLPKIPNGTWKCVRGLHRLHNMTQDFETFEITGIAGHKDLLFHWGNYNKDSEGCVLLGAATAMSGSMEMVTSSKVTFAKFMASLDDVMEFVLTVS